jgi:hypothetical protein
VSPVKYELSFYIPEDDILHSHRRENLKYYIVSSTSSRFQWPQEDKAPLRSATVPCRRQSHLLASGTVAICLRTVPTLPQTERHVCLHICGGNSVSGNWLVPKSPYLLGLQRLHGEFYYLKQSSGHELLSGMARYLFKSFLGMRRRSRKIPVFRILRLKLHGFSKTYKLLNMVHQHNCHNSRHYP